MVSPVEQAFNSAFTERTLQTMVAMWAVISCIIIGLDILAGRIINWLPFYGSLSQIALHYVSVILFPTLPTLLIYIVLRLRPLANATDFYELSHLSRCSSTHITSIEQKSKIGAIFAKSAPNSHLSHDLRVKNPKSCNYTLLLAAATLNHFCIIWCYFNAYAPSYTTFYTFPEGRYGPPLLRQQPFILCSWALLTGLIACWRNAIQHRGRILFRDESHVNVLGLALNRLPCILRRLRYAIFTSVVLFSIELLVLGSPSALLAYATYLKLYSSVRIPQSAPIETLLDAHLWWHLFWSGLSSVLVTCAVEICIEFWFGRPFGICAASVLSKDEISTAILSGMRSERSAVRMQTILELRESFKSDVQVRESIYNTFVIWDPMSRDFRNTSAPEAEEAAVGRVLCDLMVNQLISLSEHLEKLNEDLLQFGNQLFCSKSSGPNSNMSTGSPNTRPSVTPMTKSIFTTSKKKTLLDRLFLESSVGVSSEKSDASKTKTVVSQTLPVINGGDGRLPSVSTANSSSKDQNATMSDKKQQNFPQILMIPKKIVDGNLLQASLPRVNRNLENGYLRVTFAVLGPVSGTFPAQIYAALVCEIIKSWHLGDEEQVCWILDSIVALLISSYDEDPYGQTCQALDGVLSCLCRLLNCLSSFERLPLIPPRTVINDDVDNQTDPLESEESSNMANYTRMGAPSFTVGDGESSTIRQAGCESFIADGARGSPLAERLFGMEPSPTERRTHRLIQHTERALEVILCRFMDTLDSVRLSPATREGLRAMGILIS